MSLRGRSHLLALFLTTALVSGPGGAEPLEYRDWSWGQLIMIVQSITFDEAKLYDIGPTSHPGIRQVAMLISEDAELEDAGTKNALLVECGMHGREWYATESCYWWIDHLLQNRRDPLVRDLLSHVDIWVMPLTNPAGRNLDDLNYGDPTRFAFVCDAGTRRGSPCEDDSDCPDGSCYRSGWRSNANTASCQLGVDLARNFSSDWGYAPDQCATKLCRGGAAHNAACTEDTDCPGGACKGAVMQYRGDRPFSEPETRNLRRFVNNHMISMSAIVHANSQQIWNQWYRRNGASRFMTDQLVAINASASALHPPDPTMVLDGVGGGSGQFSAWLTQNSDVAGEPDVDTARNISNFYFEVPVIYTDYYQVPYQDALDDGSNSFHPSGPEMPLLWGSVGSAAPDPAAAIRPLLTYVARQARSPQCPVDDLGQRITAQCEANDFGLVGAKIADATNAPGLLDYSQTTREEILAAGRHQIVFAVQNMSATASSSSTNAIVTISTGSASTPTSVPVSLLPGERDVYSVSHLFVAGNSYEVRIQLDADNFALNNKKVFKFRVPSAVVQQPRRIFGQVRLIEPGFSGRLLSRAQFFLSESITPEQGGLEIRVTGHAQPTSGPQQGPVSFAYVLPGGAPWWSGSRPEKGRWIYKDPKAKAGPVKHLQIRRKCRKQKVGNKNVDVTAAPYISTGGTLGCRLDVDLDVRDPAASALRKERSETIELVLAGDNLVLFAATTDEPRVLPPRALLPEDELEDEPDTPAGPNDSQIESEDPLAAQ